MSRIRSSVACAATCVCLCAASPALAQTSSDASSLKGLFKGTIEDFRQVPTRESLTWLTIAGAVAAVGHTQDWDITRGMSASSRAGDFFKLGESVGGARAQAAFALGTFAVGRVTGNGHVAALGSDLVRAQILAQTMTAGIKLSARRHRPDGGEYSFPSGHSSVTFATATVLQRHYGWKVGIPAYGLASYVAASRVQVKRHFLSDVAFGAAVGIVAGRTATIGVAGARFAVAPSAGPRGAGVSFTLLDRR